jgi:hypothetical protein
MLTGKKEILKGKLQQESSNRKAQREKYPEIYRIGIEKY